MRRTMFTGALAAFILAAFSTISVPVAAQPRTAASARPSGSLTPMRSEAEFRALLRRLQTWREANPPPPPPPPPPPASPPPPVPPGSMTTATAPSADGESITNTQEAGIDEGGIVKVRGNYLVVLRRGRLFTLSIADGGMRAVDSIDAYPPGANAHRDWYDEMLVSGDWVVVIGYSYARGGTEINRFRLSPEGQLTFVDAHHLRSNDYYSSSNYASRLIGNRLIFYTPLYLRTDRDVAAVLPGIKRWNGDETDRSFRPIATPRQIFYSPQMMRNPDGVISTLHSVTTCDLTAAELDCSAIGVLGPSSRQFYVSPTGVYLWLSAPEQEQSRRFPFNRYIYRLPFDSSERPSAIGARGGVNDQFAFREDAAEGVLNVLVQASTYGAELWEPEAPDRTVALMRIPLSEFNDGSREVRRRFYRLLPNSTGRYLSENRFVGDHILYGFRMDGTKSVVVAAALNAPDAVEFELDQGLSRIEQLGHDALVVGDGEGGSLRFAAIELGQRRARLGDTYTMPAATEGEARSHAFFYNPNPATPDGASGIMGLPIARPIDGRYAGLTRSAAGMLFLRREQRAFSPLGTLDAEVRGLVHDNCVASCLDWYGNARPIFLRGRIFALLGYELVEGQVSQADRIREVGRLNFAPGLAAQGGRP